MKSKLLTEKMLILRVVGVSVDIAAGVLQPHLTPEKTSNEGVKCLRHVMGRVSGRLEEIET